MLACLAESENDSRCPETSIASQDSTRGRMVTAIFGDSGDVERAYGAPAGFGYEKGDINVVMSSDTRTLFFGASPHRYRPGAQAGWRRRTWRTQRRSAQYPDSDPRRC